MFVFFTMILNKNSNCVNLLIVILSCHFDIFLFVLISFTFSLMDCYNKYYISTMFCYFPLGLLFMS